MASKVFISYRRQDSRYQARRIYDAFVRALPPDTVFMDVASIPPGADFVEILRGWVQQCDVMLALIGPGWISSMDPKTNLRRLDNPKDFVRIEIQGALDRKITVIPVLLDDAVMPDETELPDDIKALNRLNAEFVDFRTFDTDVESLIRKLGAIRKVEPPPEGDAPSKSAKVRNRASFKWMSAAALVFAVGTSIYALSTSENPAVSSGSNGGATADANGATKSGETQPAPEASPPLQSPPVAQPSPVAQPLPVRPPPPSRTPLGNIGSSSRWAIQNAANCGVAKKSYSLDLSSGSMTWVNGEGNKDTESINSVSDDEIRTVTRLSQHPEGNSEKIGQAWVYSRDGSRVQVQPAGKAAFTLVRCP